MDDQYFVSTEKSLLEISTIHNFLSGRSYWAKGRRLETVGRAIDHSLCFGLYRKADHRLVGFARVVTDFSVFAWILDVFVLEECRGRGLGKRLMKSIMEHPDLQGLKRWGLVTDDAHSLYTQYGFTGLAHPEKLMERVSDNP